MISCANYDDPHPHIPSLHRPVAAVRRAVGLPADRDGAAVTKNNKNEPLEEIVEKYVRSQLAVMDGSAEAGISRIGEERYQRLVQDAIKTFKQFYRPKR